MESILYFLLHSVHIQVATDEEINTEGRFFVKVKENGSQGQSTQTQTQTPPQGQTQTPPQESIQFKYSDKLFETQDGAYDFIENFIISKIAQLKGQFQK